MDTFNKPSKEQVRAWMMERRQAPAPLPDIERIRLDLGWRTMAADLSLAPASALAIRISASRVIRYNTTRAAFAGSCGAAART